MIEKGFRAVCDHPDCWRKSAWFHSQHEVYCWVLVHKWLEVGKRHWCRVHKKEKQQ